MPKYVAVSADGVGVLYRVLEDDPGHELNPLKYNK